MTKQGPKLSNLRVLQGALALGEFMAGDLSTYTGVPAKTIHTAMSRDLEGWFQDLGEQRTGKAGNQPHLYRLDPERTEDANRLISEIRTSLMVTGMPSGRASIDTSANAPDEGEHQGLTGLTAAMSLLEGFLKADDLGIDHEGLMNLVGRNLDSADVDIEDFALAGKTVSTEDCERLGIARRMYEALMPAEVAEDTACGIIIRSDISELQDLDPARRSGALAKLYRYSHEQWQGEKPIVDLSPDSISVAIPEVKGESLAKSLAFVTGWIDELVSDLNMRVSIHVGDILSVGWGSQRQAIGSGMLECQRLGDLADTGGCVVSENFVSEYSRLLPDAEPWPLFPSQPNMAMEVSVGPDTVQKFRVLLQDEGATPLPPSVEAILEGGDQLQKVLEEVEESFVAKIGELDHSYDRERLSLRISLFAPIGGELRCTAYRYQHGNEWSQSSKTSYPLTRSGGVFFTSFTDGKARVVKDLPAPSKGYVGAVVEKAKIDRAIVLGFTRRARSFAVIPCAPLPGLLPEVVLCIDSADSLKAIGLEALRRVSRETMASFGVRIASCWRFRGEVLGSGMHHWHGSVTAKRARAGHPSYLENLSGTRRYLLGPMFASRQSGSDLCSS